jgi:hypothetical protein
MQTEPAIPSTRDGHKPSHESAVTTTTHYRPRIRKGLFVGAVAIVPGVIAAEVGVLTRSKRAGALAGGIAAGALALARWQLARFFIGEPVYKVEKRVGELELRVYEPCVVVRTVVEQDDILAARKAAFDRLDRYLDPKSIRMIAPFQMSREADGLAMTFVMPPGRAVATFPSPEDSRVRVMELPARRVAALPFRGNYVSEAVAKREQELLRLVNDAGVVAKGRPIFAGFDPPTTWSFLRYNEIWIAIV